jgi:hypothetical protein
VEDIFRGKIETQQASARALDMACPIGAEEGEIFRAERIALLHQLIDDACYIHDILEDQSVGK